jgi:GT2 family glycosyltransferase
MSIGVVIPVGARRAENLTAVLGCLARQTARDQLFGVVLVADGEEAYGDLLMVREEMEDYPLMTAAMMVPKHQPGMEQPRNVGVRVLQSLNERQDEPELRATHVWFMDTDVLVEDDCVEQFLAGWMDGSILVGPYDWMPPGVRQPMPALKNDPRWPSFDNAEPKQAITEDLSAGLACFSGNLIWPIDKFVRVGGFWNEIHHGRCEDGELGLRAVAMGVPVTFVPKARGYHMDHPRSMEWIQAANARDVPMLNERHPWVEKSGLFVVEEDGKRFDARCPCGWTGNTALIWQHQENECPLAIKLSVER